MFSSIFILQERKTKYCSATCLFSLNVDVCMGTHPVIRPHTNDSHSFSWLPTFYSVNFSQFSWLGLYLIFCIIINNPEVRIIV